MKEILKYFTIRKLRNINCSALNKKTIEYIKSRISDDDVDIRREALGCIHELANIKPNEFWEFDMFEVILHRLNDRYWEIIQWSLEILQIAFSQVNLSRDKSHYMELIFGMIESSNLIYKEDYDQIISACGKIQSLIDDLRKHNAVTSKQRLKWKDRLCKFNKQAAEYTFLNTNSEKFRLAAFDLLLDLRAVECFVDSLEKNQHNLLSAKGTIKIDNKGSRQIAGKSVLEHFLEASVYDYAYDDIEEHQEEVCHPPDEFLHGSTLVTVTSGWTELVTRQTTIRRIEKRNLLQLAMDIKKISKLPAEKIFAYAERLLKAAPRGK